MSPWAVPQEQKVPDSVSQAVTQVEVKTPEPPKPPQPPPAHLEDWVEKRVMGIYSGVIQKNLLDIFQSSVKKVKEAGGRRAFLAEREKQKREKIERELAEKKAFYRSKLEFVLAHRVSLEESEEAQAREARRLEKERARLLLLKRTENQIKRYLERQRERIEQKQKAMELREGLLPAGIRLEESAHKQGGYKGEKLPGRRSAEESHSPQPSVRDDVAEQYRYSRRKGRSQYGYRASSDVEDDASPRSDRSPGGGLNQAYLARKRRELQGLDPDRTSTIPTLGNIPSAQRLSTRQSPQRASGRPSGTPQPPGTGPDLSPVMMQARAKGQGQGAKGIGKGMGKLGMQSLGGKIGKGGKTGQKHSQPQAIDPRLSTASSAHPGIVFGGKTNVEQYTVEPGSAEDHKVRNLGSIQSYIPKAHTEIEWLEPTQDADWVEEEPVEKAKPLKVRLVTKKTNHRHLKYGGGMIRRAEKGTIPDSRYTKEALRNYTDNRFSKVRVSQRNVSVFEMSRTRVPTR